MAVQGITKGAVKSIREGHTYSNSSHYTQCLLVCRTSDAALTRCCWVPGAKAIASASCIWDILAPSFYSCGKACKGSLRSVWLPRVCGGNITLLPEGRKQRTIDHYRHLIILKKETDQANYICNTGDILGWPDGQDTPDQLGRIKLKLGSFKW